MHYCERCGSTYTSTAAEASRDCPSCAREGERVALRFRLFEPSALRVAGVSPHSRPDQPPRESR